MYKGLHAFPTFLRHPRRLAGCFIVSLSSSFGKKINQKSITGVMDDRRPQHQQATSSLFLGNLIDPRITTELLYEIGIQAGPVCSITMPVDPGTNKPKGFAFIVRFCCVCVCSPQRPRPTSPHYAPPQDYETLESATYAMALFGGGNLRLFGQNIRIAYSPRGRTE